MIFSMDLNGKQLQTICEDCQKIKSINVYTYLYTPWLLSSAESFKFVNPSYPDSHLEESKSEPSTIVYLIIIISAQSQQPS